MFYVYFLRLGNNQIYKGFTENLKRRLKEHNDGKVKSTSRFRPIQVIGFRRIYTKIGCFKKRKMSENYRGAKIFQTAVSGYSDK